MSHTETNHTHAAPLQANVQQLCSNPPTVCAAAILSQHNRADNTQHLEHAQQLLVQHLHAASGNSQSLMKLQSHFIHCWLPRRLGPNTASAHLRLIHLKIQTNNLSNRTTLLCCWLRLGNTIGNGRSSTTASSGRAAKQTKHSRYEQPLPCCQQQKKYSCCNIPLLLAPARPTLKAHYTYHNPQNPATPKQQILGETLCMQGHALGQACTGSNQIHLLYTLHNERHEHA
jgi:hypothetical protein